MENIEKAIKNINIGINISFLVTSIDFNLFSKMCENLLSSSNNFHDVEILLKIDNTKDIDRYSNLLENSIFKYKMLIYPKFFGKYSVFHFYNDLYKISSGKLICALGPDGEIVNGDWHRTLERFVNEKMYKDNIFNIAIPMDNGRGYKQICGMNIVSREWCDFFGCFSPLPNVDRWHSELSKKIGRCFNIEPNELLSHFPKGRRTLSKKQRKDLFKPALKEAIKKFKREYG